MPCKAACQRGLWSSRASCAMALAPRLATKNNPETASSGFFIGRERTVLRVAPGSVRDGVFACVPDRDRARLHAHRGATGVVLHATSVHRVVRRRPRVPIGRGDPSAPCPADRNPQCDRATCDAVPAPFPASRHCCRNLAADAPVRRRRMPAAQTSLPSSPVSHTVLRSHPSF